MKNKSINEVREFLVKAGIVTVATVMSLLVLNGLNPRTDELSCLNEATGEAGSAARGRGNKVAAVLTDKDGNRTYTMSAEVEFSCAAIFGEGWTDVQD